MGGGHGSIVDHAKARPRRVLGGAELDGLELSRESVSGRPLDRQCFDVFIDPLFTRCRYLVGDLLLFSCWCLDDTQ